MTTTSWMPKPGDVELVVCVTEDKDVEASTKVSPALAGSNKGRLADGPGFEPGRGFNTPYPLSRRALSTAQPPVRAVLMIALPLGRI
jgi:hypothetical protein